MMLAPAFSCELKASVKAPNLLVVSLSNGLTKNDPIQYVNADSSFVCFCLALINRILNSCSQC